MCCANIKIIKQHTSVESCIDKFCKICNFCAAYKKLRLTFLGLGFTQQCARQPEDELRSLKYQFNMGTCTMLQIA